LNAISGRLNMTPDQLLGTYADGKANELPPQVAAQIDQLRNELKAERDHRTKAEAEREQAAKQAQFQSAVQKDVSHIAGVTEREDDAVRYPYYASLPPGERTYKAQLMVSRSLALINQGHDIEIPDVLEALDRQAQEVHTSLTSSTFIKPNPATGGRDVEPSKIPRRAKRAQPSSRDAADPPPKADMTEQDLRDAAATVARGMLNADAEKRPKRRGR
jgi:hypothetical protein